MLSAQSLRDEMKRYASGELSADALEEWLAAESWDMRRWAPRGLQRFIEAIQAIFIDFGDGKLSDDQLRERLLLRYRQLQRAEEVSKQTERLLPAERPIAPHAEKVSDAVMLTGSAVVPVA